MNRVIVGYQGIGKSSLVKRATGYIDLESCNFYIDGVRPDNWHRIYGKIALELARQRYDVLTSSHRVVRDYLAEMTELSYPDVRIGVCYPELSLKKAWIQRLQQRFDDSGSEKDWRALENAKDCYESNIIDLATFAKSHGYLTYIITNLDYNLETILETGR